MVDLTFVGSHGDLVVLTVAWNKIQKVSKLVNGIPTSTPLEGLRFSPVGIVKEFPDLKGKPFPEMRKTALERFKKHLLSLKSEKEVIDYLKEDLKPHGYNMIMIYKKGFRPIRVK